MAAVEVTNSDFTCSIFNAVINLHVVIIKVPIK